MSVTPQGTLTEWSLTTTGSREGRVMAEGRCHMMYILDNFAMNNLPLISGDFEANYVFHYSNHQPITQHSDHCTKIEHQQPLSSNCATLWSRKLGKWQHVGPHL